MEKDDHYGSISYLSGTLKGNCVSSHVNIDKTITWFYNPEKIDSKQKNEASKQETVI